MRSTVLALGRHEAITVVFRGGKPAAGRVRRPSAKRAELEGDAGTPMADPYDPRVRWLKIKNPDYWSLKVDGALSGSIAIAVQTDAVFFTYELRHGG